MPSFTMETLIISGGVSVASAIQARGRRTSKTPALGRGLGWFGALDCLCYLVRLPPVLLLDDLHLVFQTELELLQADLFHLLVFA